MSIAVVDLLQELTDIDTLHESEEGAEVLIDALVSSSHFRLCGIVTCWPWPCHSAQGASVECWLELDGGGAEMQLVGRVLLWDCEGGGERNPVPTNQVLLAGLFSFPSSAYSSPHPPGSGGTGEAEQHLCSLSSL